MALTVETGAGIVGADAYLDEAAVSAYILAIYGTTAQAAWDALSPALEELYTRQGTQYLDLKYGPRWVGTRTNETQGLDHPRADLEDDDGFVVASNALAAELVDAGGEAAYRAWQEALAGRILMPTQATAADLTAELIKVGPVTVQSSFGGAGQSSQPSFPAIERLLAPFISAGAHFDRS